MILSVFAIDPGTTTGWAACSDLDTRMTCCDWPWMTGQLNGDEFQQAFDLYSMIKALRPCAVVIEDFIPMRLDKARWFLSPVRVANQLGMLLWLDKQRWILQQPSLAMTTIRDDYLKDNDLWERGRPHAMDATRHLITLVRRVTQHPEIYTKLIEKRGLESTTPL